MARERHYAGGLDLRYFHTGHWELQARIALEKVENVNLQRGADRVNSLAWFNVKYHLL
jgi:hypothetical protein